MNERMNQSSCALSFFNVTSYHTAFIFLYMMKLRLLMLGLQERRGDEEETF
jgi:hypothetical protein